MLDALYISNSTHLNVFIFDVDNLLRDQIWGTSEQVYADDLRLHCLRRNSRLCSK